MKRHNDGVYRNVIFLKSMIMEHVRMIRTIEEALRRY